MAESVEIVKKKKDYTDMFRGFLIGFALAGLVSAFYWILLWEKFHA